VPQIADTNRLPEAQTQITQLELTNKSQRLVPSGPYQAYRPTSLHTYAEWGNVDGSLRFYKADSGKVRTLNCNV